MRDVTLTDVERLVALGEAERSFAMTEDAFRAFYEQTARPVWAYLVRATGDGRLADDLLQETYYRFLRTPNTFDTHDHRRHYLFRIATNLVRDHHRRRRPESASLEAPEAGRVTADPRVAERAIRRLDLVRAIRAMTPRERSLLWLAYAQGFSHEELAGIFGVKKASLKAILFRARQRLIGLLERPAQRGGR